MRYHKHFTNISAHTIARTRFMMRDWKLSDEERRWNHMQAWLIVVAAQRRMEIPRLVRDPSAGSGFYRPAWNEIHMSKPSIVTLLHEFRHAMQHQGKAGRWVDAEKDARGWSLSLYWKIAPNTLKRLVSTGEVLHMTAADFD